MDQRTQGLRRLSQAGDLEAAKSWLRTASREGNIQAQFDAMMLIFDLHSPKISRQIREVTSHLKQVEQLTNNFRNPRAWVR